MNTQLKPTGWFWLEAKKRRLIKLYADSVYYLDNMKWRCLESVTEWELWSADCVRQGNVVSVGEKLGNSFEWGLWVWYFRVLSLTVLLIFIETKCFSQSQIATWKRTPHQLVQKKCVRFCGRFLAGFQLRNSSIYAHPRFTFSLAWNNVCKRYSSLPVSWAPLSTMSNDVTHIEWVLRIHQSFQPEGMWLLTLHVKHWE